MAVVPVTPFFHPARCISKSTPPRHTAPHTHKVLALGSSVQGKFLASHPSRGRTPLNTSAFRARPAFTLPLNRAPTN